MIKNSQDHNNNAMKNRKNKTKQNKKKIERWLFVSVWVAKPAKRVSPSMAHGGWLGVVNKHSKLQGAV